MSFVINLQKESFKFSVSHFTIFGPTSAERLHGHNYYVTCDIKVSSTDPQLGMAFDFNLIKPVIKSVCDEIDEYVLVAGKSPFLKINQDALGVEVVFGAKHYRFPKEDVKILPIVNVTSEELARYIANEICLRWPKNISIDSLALTVKETAGQSIVFERTLCTP